MKNIFLSINLSIVIVALVSCSRDNELDLKLKNSDADHSVCYDTTFTFDNKIKVILENNCVRCHNGTYIPLDWRDYNMVRNNADLIYGCASHSPGYRPMPDDGGIITDCEIQAIRSWIDGGKKR